MHRSKVWFSPSTLRDEVPLRVFQSYKSWLGPCSSILWRAALLCLNGWLWCRTLWQWVHDLVVNTMSLSTSSIQRQQANLSLCCLPFVSDLALVWSPVQRRNKSKLYTPAYNTHLYFSVKRDYLCLPRHESWLDRDEQGGASTWEVRDMKTACNTS